jgi:hypothetical protein
MVAMIKDKMVGLQEAAEMLGYTSSGLRRIVEDSRRKSSGQNVRRPTIKFFQPGKSAEIKFRPSWLDDFVAANTIDPMTVPQPSCAAPRKPRRFVEPALVGHGLDPTLIR